MRPRGEIREAILAAVDQQHQATRTGATWREVLTQVPGIDPRSPAEVAMVRRTWENMQRTAELQPVAQRTTGGRGRPLMACRAAQPSQAANDATTELAALMAAWCA